MNPFQGARFIAAAHELSQLPVDSGAEIVFAGRSNAGKSSALNRLAAEKGLARTSKTPGRTQQLVVFELRDGRRLVDLPGYGYAEVPLAMRAHWEALIETYLTERRALRGMVLIMDVRHALREHDRQLLGFCAHVGLPCHILLSKADKLSRGAAQATLLAVRKEITAAAWPATAQLFSSLDGSGVDDARVYIAALLDAAPRDADQNV